MIHPFFEKLNHYGKNRTPCVFLLDFEMQKPVIFAVSDIDPEVLLYKFSDTTNCTNDKPICKPIRLHKKPVSFSVYQKSFHIVQEHLEQGNSYLVNLTFPTPIKTSYTLKELFDQSEAKYKIWYHDEFICFSPETFIQIKEGMIYTFPMKGTIKNSCPTSYQQILDDQKEYAEHATIVDLLRNDLSQVAQNVQVKRFRFPDYIQTADANFIQISSEITGKLPNNYTEHMGTILHKLLPAGSISGAPKVKTLQIIQESEIYTRGFYTGVCGYFDGYELDTGVMIRFIEKTHHGLIFKSGGGITAQSEAEKEYQEMLDKVYFPFG